MCARLLAPFSLFCVSLLAAHPQPAAPAVRVDVYLNITAVAQPPDPAAHAEMRREMQALLARADIELAWANSATELPQEGVSHLVLVELRGTCAANTDRSAAPVPVGLKLASSASADRRILPFTWLDCDALNQFLGSVPGSIINSRHYGRAMGRLLAHELYHVLTGSEAHMTSGLTKPRLSVEDLLADHLEFAPEATAKLLSFSRALLPGVLSNEAGFDGLGADGR